jgi:hypothetical protein
MTASHVLTDDQLVLLLKLLDGNCTAAQRHSALELIQANPHAKEILISISEQSILIADIHRMAADNYSGAPISELTSSSAKVLPLLLAIAAGLLIAASIGWWLNAFADRRALIAQVTGMNGAVLWTGDSGQILNSIRVGQKLTGGTLESLTPDAWIEIAFNDGSQVSISGNSRVTFSDLGHKQLHVHNGAISADVRKQAADHPMLVHTNTATFEVLGTQLLVQSEIASSTLSVIEGAVKATRISDNQSINVPAQHRVIAAYDQQLIPQKLPDAINNWRSALNSGSQGCYGKWKPASSDQHASLGTIPFNFKLPSGQVLNLFVAAFEPSFDNRPPIKVLSDSAITVRAQMSSPQYLWCGVTMQHSNGEFAGKFQLMHPTTQEFKNNVPFELKLKLNDFQLDPSLESLKRGLPPTPADLYVESIWFHTLEQNAGLELFEVRVSVD